MPKATTYQCPNCNGVMTFDAATGQLVCEFCGVTFSEGEHDKAIPLGDAPVQAAATDHVKTVEEFLEHAPWKVDAAEYANSVEYTCPSCGAGVVADQSTVSTECPYCGNNMLVQGIATEKNIPRWVLPFSVTREEAEARMNEHFEHKWYLSRQFSAALEHMQGVYVPYHLYDIDVSGNADYLGYYEVEDSDGDSKTKHYYAIKRAGHASFERIPVDGSSKMPDGHMDAIAPFDFNKLRDFSAGYVTGYLTEVPDEDAQACLPRAEDRARNSFESDLREDARREKGVEGIEETVRSETNVRMTGVSSCVLPVWLAHCTWEDHQMLFAVNGETGRCVGDLPIEGKRRAATIAGTALGLLLLAVIIFFVAMRGSDSQTGYIVGAIILIILGTFLVDAHFRGQMHTAVEATNADMSYTSEGLVVTERWRSRKSYLRKSKAQQQLEES